MKHLLQPEQKHMILQAISSYLDLQCEDILVAYVFGSFVTENPFSDIDVGILTRDEIARHLEFELELENDLEKLAGVRVDVRILNSAPLSFCHDVIRCRNVILDRDPNLRSDFESNIFKQYFDFFPFRRLYLAEVTNAPV